MKVIVVDFKAVSVDESEVATAFNGLNATAIAQRDALAAQVAALIQERDSASVIIDLLAVQLAAATRCLML